MATKHRIPAEPTLDSTPVLAPLVHDAPTEREALAYSEDDVDEILEESFPASDPPSWNATSRVGKPPRRHPA